MNPRPSPGRSFRGSTIVSSRVSSMSPLCARSPTRPCRPDRPLSRLCSSRSQGLKDAGPATIGPEVPRPSCGSRPPTISSPRPSASGQRSANRDTKVRMVSNWRRPVGWGQYMRDPLFGVPSGRGCRPSRWRSKLSIGMIPEQPGTPGTAPSAAARSATIKPQGQPRRPWPRTRTVRRSSAPGPGRPPGRAGARPRRGLPRSCSRARGDRGRRA